MKNNSELIIESIKKSDNYFEEYNAKKVRTQADSLINQMKQKLCNCYNDTISKLDDMNRICEINYSKIEKNDYKYNK